MFQTHRTYHGQAVEPRLHDNAIIGLQVGERNFNTTPGTLKDNCPFFVRYFSNPALFNVMRTNGGNYFVNMDCEAFAHVLLYQRDRILPFLFTKCEGFDYGLYSRIYHLARSPEIKELGDWIEEKGYLEVTKLERQEVGRISDNEWSTLDTETKLILCWDTKKIPLCPAGIAGHDDGSEKCGSECGEPRPEEGERVREIVVPELWGVKETTVFDGLKRLRHQAG